MPNSKYTSAIREQIYSSLRGGNYLKTAARLAGVSYRTVLSWNKKAREGDPEYTSFYETCNQCIAQWEASTIEELNEFGNAKLKLDLLSRRNADWSQTTKTVQVVEDKINDFMSYMVEKLADKPAMLETFLRLASEYEEED